MNIYVVLIIFSSAAAASCSSLVLYILFAHRTRNLKLNFLVFFLLALTIRTLKSIFFFLLYPSMSNWILSLGFLAMAMLGPLAYNYFKSEPDEMKLSFRKVDALHIIFPLFGCIVLLISEQLAEALYFLAAVSLSGYLAYFAPRFLFRKDQKENGLDNWETVFYKSLLVLVIAFFVPFVVESIYAYTVGTGLVSGLLFFLFFALLRYSPKLVMVNKTFNVEPWQQRRIIDALEIDKIYRQPTITLSSFSRDVEVPQYLISGIVKKVYGKSFPETINALRINEVKARLNDPLFKNNKIEALAYDAGFNTISNFYSAFKKETSLSPKEYQARSKNVLNKV